MEREKVRVYTNQYGRMRDLQFAAYELYARKHGLTAKELFVLDIVWFAPNGCLQSEISERLSATKQTVSAIIKKFWKPELDSKDIEELVRLTALFSGWMAKKFGEIKKNPALQDESRRGVFSKGGNV